MTQDHYREPGGDEDRPRTLAEQWLAEYSKTRPGYRLTPLKWLSVPLLVVGTVGLLWTLPTPPAFGPAADVLNWGTLFVMAAIVYYFIVSIRLAVGTLPFVVAVVAAVAWLDGLDTPLWIVCFTLAGLGLFGHMLDHFRHGQAPPLGRELQLLMIAPLWLVAVVYRRLGIPY